LQLGPSSLAQLQQLKLQRTIRLLLEITRTQPDLWPLLEVGFRPNADRPR